MAAVCVSADGYQDVGAQLGYGNPMNAYAGGQYEHGADMQGPSRHSAWPGHPPPSELVELAQIQLPYWQQGNQAHVEQHDFSEQAEFCGGPMGGGGALDGPWPMSGGWLGGPAEWRQGQGGRGAGHAGRPKRRFCTSYPDVSMCRRGGMCAFAHSREEICAPLLDVEEEQQEPSALTDSFFMYKYKTRWCPIGVQHEWHTCVYAHNYQDARRPVSIGYGARLCPYWSKKDTSAEYSQRCPLGLRCPYSHGAKEQLYHPHYFKTVVCRDLKGKACPRQRLCAFFHQRSEKRIPPPDDVDYDQPLDSEKLPSDWVTEFLVPPFLPQEGNRNVMEEIVCSNSKADAGNGALVTYSPQPPMSQCQAQYGQQMPCVLLLPVGPMMQNGMGMNSPSHNSNIMPPPADMNSQGQMQSPAPMPSLPPNWVFVPMEGSSGMC